VAVGLRRRSAAASPEAHLVTTVLAIWGAVVATAAGLAQLVTFLRDRPRLKLDLSASVRLDQPATIIVTVANLGRQPTTIKKAALMAAAGDYTLGGGASVRPEIPLLHEHHVVLIPPGNVQRFGWTLESWPNMIFADTPLRPYVIDSYNRRTWGPASPLLRLFLNSGVPVPAGTDPRLVEPPPDYQPLIPDPIEPKWKLWKPRWQRFPKPPPRQSRQVLRTPQEEEERRQRRREAGIIGPDDQAA